MIQEKQSLCQELERQRLQVLELQDQLDVLRNQTTQERKMRANVALKISENIAQERESLVKELDMLRSVNTKVSYLIPSKVGIPTLLYLCNNICKEYLQSVMTYLGNIHSLV